MIRYAVCGTGNYVMGGKAAHSHDGTAATSAKYREAAFMANIVNGTAEAEYLMATLLLYYNRDGTPTGGYPEGSEFNHYQPKSLWVSSRPTGRSPQR
jgi:hypothetical protein